MKKLSLFIVLLLLNCSLIFSQVGVNKDGSAPDASAILDLTTTEKGFLLPRMTTYQQSVIYDPAISLIVFNLDSLDLYIYTGSYWVSVLRCVDRDTIYPWSCGDSLLDNRDMKYYATVQIGTQCWIAENLSAHKYRNGDTIPNVTDVTAWNSLTTGAFCWYNNDSATFENPFGKLYNWFAVADSRGLCPTGWDIPTDTEWWVLTDFITGVPGSLIGASGPMKETGYVHWYSPNVGATNLTGFTGIGGGCRNYWDSWGNGAFNYYMMVGWHWSSTEYQDNTTKAWFLTLGYNNPDVYRNVVDKRQASSVRCLKD